jgi:arabinogalactan endo-1,4-beta-galactosidase
MTRLYFILILLLFACSKIEQIAPPSMLYLGADLSYVNEMVDCGGIYRSNGVPVEPYQFFSEKGANLIRLRLWHNPDWTNYSNFEDVKRAIKKVKENNMAVLLDFHYSDNWADPGKQVIPAAWKDIKDLNVLKDSLYSYTYNTLQKLFDEQLIPDIVQIGNEINAEILQLNDSVKSPINWERNVALLNTGLNAVEDFSKKNGVSIQRMVHIAQPENGLWWFRDATQHGLGSYEWIGLSYYPKWSKYKFDSLSIALDSIKRTYEKKVMIVEVSYPYGMVDVDSPSNILGEDSIIPMYPATPEGQLDFMKKLVQVTIDGGGEGVVYWEPAWISTNCKTRWGKGSHWENATFFDAANRNEALKAFDFYSFKKY